MEERSVAVEVAPGRDEDVAGVEDRFASLREEVAVRGGVVLDSAGEGRYGARFCVTADDPADAVDEGVAALQAAARAAGLPEGRVVDVEAPTIEELRDHAAAREMPELMDLSGLAETLGVNRHLAPIVARSKGFPPPVAELNGGPVWARESVDRHLQSAVVEQDIEEEDGGEPARSDGSGHG